MKTEFHRRQSYRQTRRTPQGTRSCQNTRQRPLRGTDVVELAIFFDRIGLRRNSFCTVLVSFADGWE